MLMPSQWSENTVKPIYLYIDFIDEDNMNLVDVVVIYLIRIYIVFIETTHFSIYV